MKPLPGQIWTYDYNKTRGIYYMVIEQSSPDLEYGNEIVSGKLIYHNHDDWKVIETTYDLIDFLSNPQPTLVTDEKLITFLKMMVV